jgi:hypothetical protein
MKLNTNEPFAPTSYLNHLLENKIEESIEVQDYVDYLASCGGHVGTVMDGIKNRPINAATLYMKALVRRGDVSTWLEAARLVGDGGKRVLTRVASVDWMACWADKVYTEEASWELKQPLNFENLVRIRESVEALPFSEKRNDKPPAAINDSCLTLAAVARICEGNQGGGLEFSRWVDALKFQESVDGRLNFLTNDNSHFVHHEDFTVSALERMLETGYINKRTAYDWSPFNIQQEEFLKQLTNMSCNGKNTHVEYTPLMASATLKAVTRWAEKASPERKRKETTIDWLKNGLAKGFVLRAIFGNVRNNAAALKIWFEAYELLPKKIQNSIKIALSNHKLSDDFSNQEAEKVFLLRLLPIAKKNNGQERKRGVFL